MANRVDRFDRVVERAHSGGDPEPFGGLEAKRGIVDDGARLQARIDDAAFDQGGLVGDAADRRVFASRERGRDRDMDEVAAVAAADSAGEIDAVRSAGGVAVGQDRSGCDLGGIDRTAAAEADHAVGIDALHLGGQLAHGCSGNMLGGALVHRGAARPHRSRDLIEQLRFAQRFARDDDRMLEAAAFEFLA